MTAQALAFILFCCAAVLAACSRWNGAVLPVAIALACAGAACLNVP